jgi:hypothetical protein
VRFLNPFRILVMAFSLPAWLIVQILDWVTAEIFRGAAETSDPGEAPNRTSSRKSISA